MLMFLKNSAVAAAWQYEVLHLTCEVSLSYTVIHTGLSTQEKWPRRSGGDRESETVLTSAAMPDHRIAPGVGAVGGPEKWLQSHLVGPGSLR